VNDPEGRFIPENVKAVSGACYALAMWVTAMYKWFFVNKKVIPLRASVKEATSQYNAAIALLKEKKDNLQRINDKIKHKQDELDKTIKSKEDNQAAIEISVIKLDRADRLLGGLGGENERWTKTVAILND